MSKQQTVITKGDYKTKDGRDVRIVEVVDDVAIGYMNHNPHTVSTWQSSTGRLFFNGKTSGADLVDPNAKKPIKMERWLTIYRDDSLGFSVGGQHHTMDKAKRAKGGDCVAITKVTIDCMEGDNLE